MSEYRLNQPQSPYNFQLLLAITARYDFPARQIVSDNTLWRVTNGQMTSYHLDGQNIVAQALSSSDLEQHRNNTLHIFGLQRDLTDFYTFAKSDNDLWSIIEPLHGLPIYCTETVFEALITLIIEQHITWKNALRSQRTLMEILDTKHQHDDIVVYDFPSPQQIASATLEQLKPLKITHRRIDGMIRIAQGVVDDALDLESIRYMDTAEAYSSLMKIKGVGHWTANNVIGRAVGRFPHISHNDVALQAAVLHYFHDDAGKKSAQQTTETLAVYGDYAGLVGHFTLLRWVLDRYLVVH